jgi:hypothetical protein
VVVLVVFPETTSSPGSRIADRPNEAIIRTWALARLAASCEFSGENNIHGRERRLDLEELVSAGRKAERTGSGEADGLRFSATVGSVWSSTSRRAVAPLTWTSTAESRATGGPPRSPPDEDAARLVPLSPVPRGRWPKSKRGLAGPRSFFFEERGGRVC